MGLAFCQRDELVRCVPKSCQHVAAPLPPKGRSPCGHLTHMHRRPRAMRSVMRARRFGGDVARRANPQPPFSGTLCQVRMRQRIIYSTVTRAPSALAALAPHTHAPRARSCWTFATTSALSDRLRIHSRGAINVLLSAQNWLLL